MKGLDVIDIRKYKYMYIRTIYSELLDLRGLGFSKIIDRFINGEDVTKEIAELDEQFTVNIRMFADELHVEYPYSFIFSSLGLWWKDKNTFDDDLKEIRKEMLECFNGIREV